RRHTRFSRDWSSDVCSSDLGEGSHGVQANSAGSTLHMIGGSIDTTGKYSNGMQAVIGEITGTGVAITADGEGSYTFGVEASNGRSEERRAGKRGRSPDWRGH